MTQYKGFATISVLLVLSGLLMITVYTSYTVYLQLCFQAHQKIRQQKNKLLASVELYVKQFAIENWKMLRQESGTDNEIVIKDFFQPHLFGHSVTLRNMSASKAQGRIEYLLMHNDRVIAHKTLYMQKNEAGSLSCHLTTV